MNLFETQILIGNNERKTLLNKNKNYRTAITAALNFYKNSIGGQKVTIVGCRNLDKDFADKIKEETK